MTSAPATSQSLALAEARPTSSPPSATCARRSASEGMRGAAARFDAGRLGERRDHRSRPADQRALQRRPSRGVDRRVVAPRPATEGGLVGLPEGRRVNHAGDRAPVVDVGDRHRPARIAGQKRPRAVDRIDDEKVRHFEARQIVGRLLGEPTVAGKSGAEPFAQVTIDRQIRGRDRRAAVFGVNLGARLSAPAEIAQGEIARPPRGVGDFIERRAGAVANVSIDGCVQTIFPIARGLATLAAARNVRQRFAARRWPRPPAAL